MYPYRYRDFSKIAAEAALSAQEQGKFLEMHNLMLERSPKLERENLIFYAGQIGLDIGRFAKDLDSMRHAKIIERDVKLAEDMDLFNTPTFFFNGRKVIGNRPYEYLKEIIEEELIKAGRQ